MSWSCGTADAAGGKSFSAWGEGRGCRGLRFRPLEILAVVIAFAIWWPLAVALLVMKFAAKRDLTWANAASALRGTMQGFGGGAGGSQWRPFTESGNVAFDDWRTAELARLEEERRKLDEAQRDFASHMADLRRARDKEEFDRFMAARNTKGPQA